MRDVKGLLPLLAVLAVLALALLLAGAAVSQDRARLIIPSPEQTADGFTGAMQARRYTGALNQLSQDLQQRVGEEELKSLMQSIEESQGGIQDVQDEGFQEQGDAATARVKVKLGRGQEATLEYPLQKENCLWKVSSIDSLRALAGAPK